MSEPMAWQELHEYLRPGETVEGIVFGVYGGWGDKTKPAYDEPTPPPVPLEQRGVVMSLADAEPFMRSWRFTGGFGGADCYPVHIWTSMRVIWVHEYDGSTRLASAPRHPTAGWPLFDGDTPT